LSTEVPATALCERLGILPTYSRWLQFVLRELTAEEIAAAPTAEQRWLQAWAEFPECQIELTFAKAFGECLPAILKGDRDPLDVIFPSRDITFAHELYQDSPTFRPSNLLAQKALLEIVRGLPNGRALRVLEIGAGTGGIASHLLPVMPSHSSVYVLTDLSQHFLTAAQRQFEPYSFVQYQA